MSIFVDDAVAQKTLFDAEFNTLDEYEKYARSNYRITVTHDELLKVVQLLRAQDRKIGEKLNRWFPEKRAEDKAQTLQPRRVKAQEMQHGKQYKLCNGKVVEYNRRAMDYMIVHPPGQSSIDYCFGVYVDDEVEEVAHAGT